MQVSLCGKSVLITGASTGIGRACAIEASKSGAKLHLLGRNPDTLTDTLKLLEGEGHSYSVLDLTDFRSYGDTISQIVSKHGKISGFVHSAGIQYMLPFQSTRVTDYMDTLSTNTISAFELSRHITNKKHHTENNLMLVYIASVMSVNGASCQASYCASKAALVAGARCLAVELAPKHINVNCISPGSIEDTNLANLRDGLVADSYQSVVAEHLLGLGHTEDISSMCVYLLSDKAKWITGQNFIVDGGYSAK